ncbi:DNA-binding response regulator [Paenibacillus alba]|uniref:DNA-binding response regulator n=1 Tax=Paenibacillus alba TaxID=1197127 RepID=A0ABU6G736_9BACL|nr:DNA-binding response regulator [Paenibacillus alba]MEC0229454.1 DNA-binding response regulator [Paenibacillus alba]
MNEARQLAIEDFLVQHLAVRKGERLRKLKEGLGHGEKLFLQQVWWPAFHNFNNLHPEYEIKDFRDGTRFLDFAFFHHALKLAIEIDGYGPHSTQITRTQFADQWIRQNHLIIDGWKILRFSFDDVKDRPRMCEQILQQFMGRFLSGRTLVDITINHIESEIIRLALSGNGVIKPSDVSHLLHFGIKKSCDILKAMTEKRLLKPAGSGTKCIRSYRLHAHTQGIWEEQNQLRGG